MDSAVKKVIKKFIKLGLSEDLIETGPDTHLHKKFTEISQEVDEETLLVTQIKSQNKEQKASQSYEQNMKGMQETFASGFGMSGMGFYPGTSNYNTS